MGTSPWEIWEIPDGDVVARDVGKVPTAARNVTGNVVQVRTGARVGSSEKDTQDVGDSVSVRYVSQLWWKL